MYICRFSTLRLVHLVLLRLVHLVDQYTFTPNKSYAYLSNIEPSNLVFLKKYNAEFDKITATFTDQNGIPLEIED